MLIDKLYKIKGCKLDKDNDKVTAEITINPNHKIFEGHFPGNPVLPGVCMVQIIKEITEKALNKSLILVKSRQIKFLNMIVPQQNIDFTVEIKIKESENSTYNVSALLFNGETKYCNLKGEFKEAFH